MEQLPFALWWPASGILVCLLLRAWQQSLFSKYPFFYGYVSIVACADITRHYLYERAPQTYRTGWWISEFITAVVGLAVTWEIFSQILLPYKGVLRMARAVLLALFAIVLVKTAIDWRGIPLHDLIPTTVEIERNLRVVQALLLLAMVGLIVHYALPMGRNIRLMMWGYGSYLGFHVVLLTLRSERGPDFEGMKVLLESLWYCGTLVVWCAGMWSYHVNPGYSTALERDYDQLSRQTSRALSRLRSHLLESWRA